MSERSDILISRYSKKLSMKKRKTALMDILQYLVDNPESHRVYDFLNNLVDDGCTNREQDMIVVALGDINNQKKSVPILSKLITNKKLYTRSIAAVALGNTHSRSAIPYLLDIFTSEEDWEVKGNCILALSLLMDKDDFVNFINKNIDNLNKEEKRYAIEASLSLPKETAIQYLNNISKNEQYISINKYTAKYIAIIENETLS